MKLRRNEMICPNYFFFPTWGIKNLHGDIADSFRTDLPRLDNRR